MLRWVPVLSPMYRWKADTQTKKKADALGTFLRWDLSAGLSNPGSIAESGRSPGGGNNNPLQYSCLKNPMDRGAWWATSSRVAKSQTWLSDFTFTFHYHALEEEMATHSSVLAWRIPGTAESGGLPSLGWHRVGHDWKRLSSSSSSSCCIAKGILLNALWWPKWEGNPKQKGYIYVHKWFTSLYSRN